MGLKGYTQTGPSARAEITQGVQRDLKMLNLKIMFQTTEKGFQGTSVRLSPRDTKFRAM